MLLMPGDGQARHAEMTRDLGIAEALANPQRMSISRRQLRGVERRPRRRLHLALGPPYDEASDRGGDRRMPGDQVADGRCDVGRKRVLEQIAGGADGDRRYHALFVAEDRDHHDLGLGEALPSFADQIDAVTVRQLQVGQQHPWTALAKHGAGLGQGRGGLRLVAGLGKGVVQPPAGRRVVLDEQNRDDRSRAVLTRRCHRVRSGRRPPQPPRCRA
jgi:hypothetical protein